MDKIFKIGLLVLAILIVTLSASTMATDLFNYGQRWKSWSVGTRNVYLEGFQDGSNHAYWTAGDQWLAHGDFLKNPALQKVKKVSGNVHFFVELSVIRDVMTGLYEDPANTFIKWETVLYLARDKLMGEDISERLIKARKFAIEEWELLQKME